MLNLCPITQVLGGRIRMIILTLWSVCPLCCFHTTSLNHWLPAVTRIVYQLKQYYHVRHLKREMRRLCALRLPQSAWPMLGMLDRNEGWDWVNEPLYGVIIIWGSIVPNLHVQGGLVNSGSKGSMTAREWEMSVWWLGRDGVALWWNVCVIS